MQSSVPDSKCYAHTHFRGSSIHFEGRRWGRQTLRFARSRHPSFFTDQSHRKSGKENVVKLLSTSRTAIYGNRTIMDEMVSLYGFGLGRHFPELPRRFFMLHPANHSNVTLETAPTSFVHSLSLPNNSPEILRGFG